MKIGLLQCDDVMDELQPRFGNYPGMFHALFRRVDPDIELMVYDVRKGEYPATLDECDAYTTTGSKHGVLDGLDWVDRLEDFVRRMDDAKKKFAGVCFGHQVMARALGGEVEKSPAGWQVGVSFNRIEKHKPWMEPFQPELNLIVSHQDQVSRVPVGMEVLASNDHCPYYMLQHGDHFISVQGHPEFPRAYSRALTLKRLDRIPSERAREGLASLDSAVDDEVMARWIVRFLGA